VRNLIRLKALIDDKIESERRLEMERERRSIMRDVIYAVSGGKLVLAEDSELEQLRAGGGCVRNLPIARSSDVGTARAATEEALLAMGIDRDRVFDVVLCVSEAATNALKHAHGGVLEVYRFTDRAQIWVSDHGSGIDFSLLPRSTLMKGWSSKTSLGYGYTILLELLDRVLLSTSRRGTTVVMEMALETLPDTSGSTVERFLSDWNEPGTG
jgi:anti-sigma regulatory factor (Ser/Thr protein kinase)